MDLTPIINSLPPEVWLAVLGGVVSVVTQAAKKWLDLQSPRVVMALTTALSVVATAVPSLLSAVSHDPTILGQHAAIVIGIATLAYRYIIQPADSFLVGYKQYKASQLSENTAITAPVTAPIALPVETQPISTNEFIG